MRTNEMKELLDLTGSIGKVYGSENTSLFLYSLIKRQKPDCIVELGTGMGLSSLWMGLGQKENGHGELYTIDNGQEANLLTEDIVKIFPQLKGEDPEKSYEQYMNLIFESYSLTNQINFMKKDINLASQHMLMDHELQMVDKSIDVLFADTSYGPYDALNIMRQFLPYMSEYSSILIDSASTHLPTYLTLEKMIEDLNRSKIPQHFLSIKDPKARWNLFQLVSQRTFKLVHLNEKEKRKQNSTAWIIIEPNEYIPQPDVATH
ncbi:class I SAM-dependent methyltransferase [Pontibacillus salipaludis]|uniref:class I SAM-dependent methyltransferase n=1 Tax=Pontibacillus salipaludis TaxID=1697394 RepID=UPI0031E7071B